MTGREDLIAQLRHALHLATSPDEDVVEFEIGDTDFSFEFDDDFQLARNLNDMDAPWLNQPELPEGLRTSLSAMLRPKDTTS